MNRDSPYGLQRVRRSLIHFFLGKGISSVAGFAYFLLVVRLLPIAEFATYSVLLALVDILAAVTGFGLLQVLLRYVPELHALHQNRTLAKLVYWVLSLRSLILFGAVLLIYLAAGKFATWVGLAGWEGAFKAYLLVVGLRVTANCCIRLLESMLLQGLSQLASTLTTVSKLLLVILLYSLHNDLVSLPQLIAIEATAEAGGLILLLFAIVRSLRRSIKQDSAGDSARWIRDNFHRMLKFGAAGYGQHLALIPGGSSASRLLVGRLFDTPVVAVFGFAQSVIDFVLRYLPGKLLLGMVRPVILARYASSHNFDDLSKSINLVFKVDCSVLGFGIILLAVAGDPISSLLSSGKYAGMAGNLILALLVAVLLDSLINLLWLSLEALEKNRVMLLTNILLSSSILLIFPLASIAGPFAVAWAKLIGFVTNIALLLTYLRRTGNSLWVDWGAFLKFVAAILASALLGRGLISLGVVWWVACSVAIVFYPLTIYASKAFSLEETQSLRRLAKR